jgi:hypothetical protein
MRGLCQLLRKFAVQVTVVGELIWVTNGNRRVRLVVLPQPVRRCIHISEMNGKILEAIDTKRVSALHVSDSSIGTDREKSFSIRHVRWSASGLQMGGEHYSVLIVKVLLL